MSRGLMTKVPCVALPWKFSDRLQLDYFCDIFDWKVFFLSQIIQRFETSTPVLSRKPASCLHGGDIQGEAYAMLRKAVAHEPLALE